MPRLIDADALKEQFNFPDEAGRMGELIGEVIKAVIDDAPTVEERKVGKWILDKKSNRHRCSECLAVASRDDFGKEYLSDYCGVCGARMESC